MPKARQRYLLAKFTSMKKLKVFLDVAENARQQVRPLQHQLLTHIESHITIRDGALVKGFQDKLPIQFYYYGQICLVFSLKMAFADP